MKRFFLALVLGALGAGLLMWGCASVLLAEGLVRRGGVGALAAYSPAAEPGGGETWRVQAADGVTLSGVFRPGASHRWALLLHGYTAGKEAMGLYADAYAARGWCTLAPDLRGHGDSGGRYVGMGWADKGDVLCWLAAIRARDPEAEIVLHGVSMGGAAALSAAAARPAGLMAVVSDCAYSDLWELTGYQAARYLGASLTPLRYGASLATRFLAGYRWQAASPESEMQKIGVPTLLLHGDADRFVPVSMAYALYSAAECPKRLVLTPGAGHAASALRDPEGYWQAVFSFLEETALTARQ